MNVKPSLTLKRRLKAPPSRVYGAWTEPGKLTQWFGPEGAETLTPETDARVGGRFHVLMRTADGEEHGVSVTVTSDSRSGVVRQAQVNTSRSSGTTSR